MAGYSSAGAAAELVQEIELIISAKDLKNKDVFSKSDPMCVVWIESADRNGWNEYERTEMIRNSLNPEFSKRIRIQYRFEELQKMKFAIYDVDHPIGPLNSQDFLGEAACTLGQIVSAGRLVLQLAPHSGRIVIESQDMSNNKEVLELLFSAQQLPKSSLLSEPDPFLVFYRISPDARQTRIHETPHVDNTRRPSWPKFSVPLCLLEGKDQAAALLIQCLNHNGNGNHKLIGQIQVNSSDLLQAPKTFELKTASDKSKKSKGCGQLVLHEAQKIKVHTFLDYVYGGTQLNCTFAIDFTASNGDPRNPSSLHFQGGGMPSQYEMALRSVGQIIQDYDSDKQFPVLGFGARVPPTNQLSHEFFVNLSPSPYCSGIDGVVDAYRRCLQSVTLYGPTNFAPIIRHVTRFAASYPDGGNYFILLILTDGAICDMGDTKMALIEASVLPVSVIIVGVGNADFSSMRELDGDEVALSVNGRRAHRDIVQFVAFRDFLSHQNPNHAGLELARSLLKEIPTQLVSFMNSRGLSPRNKLA